MKTSGRLSLIPAAAALLASALPSHAELPGDRMLAEYFRGQTAAIHSQAFAGIQTLADWKQQREGYREQLREMLGLSPLPPRTPLQATITGREEHAEFTVEKLHFQSQPGLYITANLYLPKGQTKKAPTILYLSGHSRVREGTVSFGSKATYQHHGEWFARNGYVCLTLDSIGELAEIEGQHHGTHSGTRWWWNSRGYTPAGAEAWNAMRAIDYLETRPEVDAERIGATGRSGGGVTTWWTAAIDERIKVAVPVAGMTDLQNQVVDGKVSRHCDCMFMVNTYRWDYAKVAALLAPRPLLFSNTDKDEIFPLDGVVRMHQDVAAIYKLYAASDKLGLLITDGPHQDSQDLQVPSFRWFNRFLKNDVSVIDGAAKKFFTPAQLKVFATIPADQRNTTLDEWFIPAAKPTVPQSSAAWEAQRTAWMQSLAAKTFAGWPATEGPLLLKAVSRETMKGLTLSQWEFTSQESIRLPLFVFSGRNTGAAVHLFVLDQQGWRELRAELGDSWSLPAAGSVSSAAIGNGSQGSIHRTLLDRARRGEIALAYLPPRGIGPTEWSGDEQAQTHLRRRFMLLGQTLEGMRAWDIRRALAALAQPELFPNTPVRVAGERAQAVNAVYASLFATNVAALDLYAVPASHATGPDYLNVMRILDIPQAAALAASRAQVRLHGASAGDWAWPLQTAQQLGWPADRFQLVP